MRTQRVLALLLLPILFIAACDDDDGPTRPNDGNEALPATPEALVAALTAAVEAQSGVGGLLHPDFRFVPAAHDAALAPSIGTWNVGYETALVERMLSGVPGLRMADGPFYEETPGVEIVDISLEPIEDWSTDVGSNPAFADADARAILRLEGTFTRTDGSTTTFGGDQVVFARNAAGAEDERNGVQLWRWIEREPASDAAPRTSWAAIKAEWRTRTQIDPVAPNPVTDLEGTLTGAAPVQTLELRWTRPLDTIGVAGYELLIAVDGTALASDPTSATARTIVETRTLVSGELEATVDVSDVGTIGAVALRALDAVRNASDLSNVVTFD